MRPGDIGSIHREGRGTKSQVRTPGAAHGTTAEGAADARLEAELTCLASDWDLGAWRELRLIPRGQNQSFHLHTSQGEFVLRRSREGKDAEDLAFEHALIARARAGGIPAPEVVPRRDGASYARIGVRLWSVSRFVRGAPYGSTAVQRQAVAELLARCHRCFGDLGVPARAPAPVDRLADACAALSRLEGGGARATRLAAVAQAMERLPEAPPPYTVIHGGCRKTSLLFEGDRTLALFDFDSARRGTRAEDVAIMLVSFARSGRGGPALGVEKARQLCDIYQRVFPLSAEEAAALPRLAGGFLLFRAVWALQRSLAGDASMPSRVDDRIGEAAWVAGHPAEFATLFPTA